MPDSGTLHLWRLVPRTCSTHPEVWACSRLVGPCEVVAVSEHSARLQARGVFLLPLAPGCWSGTCPWLDPDHVGAELIARSVRAAPGIHRDVVVHAAAHGSH